MTFFTLSFITLMIVCALFGMPGSFSSNFPLQNCSTDKMDIVIMHYNPNNVVNRNEDRIHFIKKSHRNQLDMRESLLHHMFSFPNINKVTKRVMQASVCDTFSVDDPNANVSSWTLCHDSSCDTYGSDCYNSMNMPYLNVEQTLGNKIKFVQRLFSEMSGVRDNVTHIAVIFLDGADWLYENSRKIPNILQKHNTSIKIFVVVQGNQHEKEIIHLSDTLIVPPYERVKAGHALVMAMCQQCEQGWISFQHKHSTDSLSCYHVITSTFNKNWFEVMRECMMRYHGSLAAIETQEEMYFLRSQSNKIIREYVETTVDNPNIREYAATTVDDPDMKACAATAVDDPDHTYKLSFQVYIGLQRDLSSSAKRFEWKLQNPNRYRPLVVNNWLCNKPSGGRNNACGMWQFVWENHNNDTNVSHVHEGWIDVGCNSPLSKLGLCEINLPCNTEDIKFMRENNASSDSFTKTLNKGDFRILNYNIVSVSSQIGSVHFHTIVNDTNRALYPVFDCGEDAGDPRYISYVLVCDNIHQCCNKRDEIGCLLEPLDVDVRGNEDTYVEECHGYYCCDGSCLQRQWYYDGELDCTLCDSEYNINGTDESDATNGMITYFPDCALFCNIYKCISFSQLNDGRPECTGPEGPLDETIGKLETVKTCKNPTRRKIWAPRCVYIKDSYGAVLGCRDMFHLENCENFTCPEGYSKCPNSYCVPQHYILDGKVDCPTGEDEVNDNADSCFENFKCWNSQMCLYPDLVCDGHADCPHQDDEIDCYVPCPLGLLCVLWRLTVSDYNSSVSLDNFNLIDTRIKYLDMSGIDLSAVQFLKNVSRLENVVSIKWSRCKIKSLHNLLQYFSRKVQILDISYNLIEIFNYSVLEYQALENIRFLNLSYNEKLVDVKYLNVKYVEILDLSHTSLTFLDNHFFQRLPNIKHLNLSYTFISDLYQPFVSSKIILQTLDLRGLHFENLYENMFSGLTIGRHLFTDSFEVCCHQIRGDNILAHTCHAPTDVISSCLDLVGANVQRVLLWLVAVLAVLGNLTVIVYRVIWDRSVLRTGYGLFVTNLGISDFIMGVYLFIIAGTDHYYRDRYVLYDKIWRESIVCKLAGFLATLSSETSTYFICLITLDRFLVMKYPFGQIRFTEKGKIISLLLSWIIGFFLALVPIMFKFELYSSNAVCLGLPLTSERLRGWEYSFSLYIVHNFCMFLVIAYGQRAIFSALYGSRTTEMITTNRRKDVVVAKQLFLIAASNFLCWFPIGLMGLLSLSGHKISNDVYSWTIVVILPINCAANPLLYTIPALMDKWDKYKQGNI